jgi:hypothetical protein
VSFYHNNIDLICKKYPSFKNDILDKFTLSSNFLISESKSGYPTAKIDGKYIHSNRDPVREAERLIQLEIPQGSSSCIVEGFGLGYYIEAILKLRPDVPVIVTEPSPERFLKALEERSFKTIIDSPMISLLIGNKTESIRLLLPGLPRGSIQIFKHRALYELDIDYYKEVNSFIQHFVSRREVNTATLKKFGELWVRNLINNLDYISEAQDVGSLTDIFKEYPVLLLAAGPSLDNILPHIKELQKRFIIVSVDTSTPVIIKNGCVPDFTVVVDPQYWNTRHLDRVDLQDTILMSESSTHPGIFRKNHNKLFFCGSLFPLGIFIEKYVGRRKRLGAGGSVSTTAWDFCRLLSKGEIISGGLDLGFPNSNTHFHGSFFEETIHTTSSRLKPLETSAFRYLSSGNTFFSNNNTGSKTLTDQRLGIYVKWFEEQIKVGKISNVWNISPLGIRIKGMEYKKEEDLFKYPVIRHQINLITDCIKIISRPESLNFKTRIKEGMDLLYKELDRLSSLSEKALEHISDYRKNPENKELVSVFLKNLDNLDKQIMNSNSKKISSFLLQPIIDEITGNKQINTFDEGIEESNELYFKIQSSADFHKTLVQSYLQKYSN